MKKTLIIAEAGVNHNGKLEMALRLVDEAARAGADVIKFQSFSAGKVASASAPKADYQTKSTSAAESQLEMLKSLEISEDMHKEIMKRCQAANIEFLSTPFDLGSVDLLDRLGLRRLKIASGDITFAPLLLQAARCKKKIILSTGMSTLGEIELALGVLAFGYLHSEVTPSRQGFEKAYFSTDGQKALEEYVTLLHCTSEYPSPFAETNLRAMATLERAFHLPVGLSDHTVGISIPIAAVALGAAVVEKHFTLDRLLPGPDHKASLNPEELGSMVRSIREVESALGDGLKRPSPVELKNRSLVRRSLVAAGSISTGDLFTFDNVTCKRPANGQSPMMLWDIVGTKATQEVSYDEPL